MFDAAQYEAAWRLAVDLEQQLTEVARLTGDSQLNEDAALMRRYQQTLADAVWQTQQRQPRIEETPTAPENGERPYRGSTTTTPDLPEVEIK